MRWTQQKTQSLTRIALVLGILILVNIISIRFFTRIDLTKEKLYTLADASKNLVRSLDDKLVVKAYFTEDLPSPYNNNRRFVQDELDDYRAYSNRNLQYEFINPSDEKTEQEAQRYGIPPVQVQVINNEKLEVKKAYMGMVFLYEDKQEIIPVVQRTENLEYEISSTIKRITSKTMKKIGFLTGHKEPTFENLKNVRTVLSKQYQLTTVDVSGGKSVPNDVSALVVLAPETKFTENEKYQIDQYIMRGGRVAFLINKIQASLQTQYGQPLDLNLDDLLQQYGVRVNNDLVRDVQCASVTVMQQQGFITFQNRVPFPYLPLASDFNKNNMIVKDLQGIVFVFVSSIDTSSALQKGSKAEVLVRSSKRSGRQQGFFIINPLQRLTDEAFHESRIPLAVAVEGKFQSLYANKPVPTDTTIKVPITIQTIPVSSDNRMVVVGDGDFVKDEYLGGMDNLNFFANMIDWLVDDAGLITIRSRAVDTRPLEEVSDGAKRFIKYGNLIVPPLAVVIYGLVRWRLRAARKRSLQLS